MLNLNSKKYNKRRGFTLIELVVSMGLFLFILTISMGTLLHVVEASRKASSMRIAMDNLNLAVEDMSRNIRQGYRYHCGDVAPYEDTLECKYINGGDNFFAFEPFNGNTVDPGDQVVYRLNGTTIEKSSDSGSTWYAITSPNIEIRSLMFYYKGRGGAGNEHPIVSIVLHGSVGSSTSFASDFTIQTSIAQRSLRN